MSLLSFLQKRLSFLRHLPFKDSLPVLLAFFPKAFLIKKSKNIPKNFLLRGKEIKTLLTAVSNDISMISFKLPHIEIVVDPPTTP